MVTNSSDKLWLNFGAWIKERRDQLKFSQAGAANRAEIDRQQWYRIENGLSGTRRDTVVAIANAISVDPAEALRRAGFGTGNGSSDEEEGLFSGYKNLSPERQALAKRQIKAIIDSLSEQDHDFDYIDDKTG